MKFLAPEVALGDENGCKEGTKGAEQQKNTAELTAKQKRKEEDEASKTNPQKAIVIGRSHFWKRPF